jgi:hypothetical protein
MRLACRDRLKFNGGDGRGRTNLRSHEHEEAK